MNFFVDGYWNSNLGDDIFLKTLSERYSEDNFFIYVDERNYRAIKDLKNVHPIFESGNEFINKIMYKLGAKFKIVLPGSRESKIYNYIKKYNNFIEIGGSIFIQNKNSMDGKYALRNKVSKNKKVNYCIIGSNFGPYYKEYQILNYRNLLKKVRGISFRDEYSFNIFKDIPAASWYPDIVFGLNVQKYKKSKDFILISVIRPKDKNIRHNYQKWLIKLINDLTVLKKERVVLMSFCENEGDLSFANNLYYRINSKGRENVMIYNHTSVEASLELFAKAKKVVATRFHSMILSWIFDKPVFVISYSDKTDNVINSIAPRQNFVKIDNLNSEVSCSYTNYSEKYFDNAKDEAKGHFRIIDVLKKEYQ